DAEHDVAEQPPGLVPDRELPVAQPSDAAALGADPQVTRACRAERADLVLRQALRLGQALHHAAVAEPERAALGADPDAAVGAGRQRTNQQRVEARFLAE